MVFPRPTLLDPVNLSIPLLAATLLVTGCVSTRASESPLDQDSPPPTLELLRPGVWVHTSLHSTRSFGRVISNGILLVSGPDALLVDTAWGDDPVTSTEAVLDELDQSSDATVRRAVFSHHHVDSVAGIEALRRNGIPTYSTERTARLMTSAGWPAPDSLLRGGEPDVWRLRYGSREVEVFFAGPGHTVDNVVVYVPDAGVLYGGCLIRPGDSTTLGNTSDADVEAWAESVARVKARYGGRVDIVVPSHGVVGGVELLDHTIRLVEAHNASGGGG